MSGLTTHILDLTSGTPAAEVAIRLSRLETPGAALADVTTNADGRAHVIEADSLTAGGYRLAFEIGAYFRRTGASLADPAFLECVAIEFHVTDPAVHHHVPLLVSPFGYSTYRGS